MGNHQSCEPTALTAGFSYPVYSASTPEASAYSHFKTRCKHSNGRESLKQCPLGSDHSAKALSIRPGHDDGAGRRARVAYTSVKRTPSRATRSAKGELQHALLGAFAFRKN